MPAKATREHKVLDPEAVIEAAECLRALAHPQRLRMLDLLLRRTCTVGELAEACDIPPNVASEHLNLMRRCGILGVRRSGRKAFYYVIKPEVDTLIRCVRRWAAAKRRDETGDREE